MDFKTKFPAELGHPTLTQYPPPGKKVPKVYPEEPSVEEKVEVEDEDENS